MARPNKRNLLLDAATEVVLSKGARALTLDAVSAAASVSKGGLLYHFKTRRALIGAMVERLLARFSTALPALGDGDFVQAYVARTSDPKGAERDVSAGLLAALADEPQHLAPLKDQMSRWSLRAWQESPNPALALVAMLAADGLWYNEVLGLGGLQPDQRQAVIDTLEKLAAQSQQEDHNR